MRIVLEKNEKCANNPTNYFVIVDVSGSMWGSIDELKSTLLATTELLNPDDTLSVAWFSSSGEYDWVFKGAKPKFENFKKLINDKIYARGLTCYTEVLESLDTVVKDVQTLTGNNNSALYFLSDGWPNHNSPESRIMTICKKNRNIFGQVVVVGYSNYYNRNILMNMAETINGSFAHVSNYKEMKVNATAFVKGKKVKRKITIDRKYDLVWQLTDSDILVLEQNDDASVDVFEMKNSTELFGIDYSEIESINSDDLTSSKFVYSLAYVLSQKGKANVAVSLLRKAGLPNDAKMLQKAFTVLQKGKAENILKDKAIQDLPLITEDVAKTIPLQEFIDDVKAELGSITLELGDSEYRSISKKTEDVSKVEFETMDKNALIVDVTANENRPNISFLTVRKGKITKVNDPELKDKIDTFNKNNPGKEIVLPIEADTYRNYTLIANGDFNFEKIAFSSKEGKIKFNPEKYLDIFDDTNKKIDIKDFVSLYKQLIEEKAHASVLNFYIKENSTVKHIDDIRVQKYGQEGADILNEMGLDYQMRYAPKRGSTARGENDDFIPFVEITAALKGSATINAKTSYEKYLKKGKKNPGDEICWPLFEKYDKMKNTLDKETFVESLQTLVKGVDKMVDLLKGKVSAIKFYLITTNSWFDGVEKADEFEYDGLVIKTKETKEYI